METFLSLIGLLVIMLIAWLFSPNKRIVEWRVVVSGLLLQLVLGVLILKTDGGRSFFNAANALITTLIGFSDRGAEFLFGADFKDHFFAFSVLPTIIFVSSISYVLFYWGIMQRVVAAMAYVMQKTMRVSGAECLATTANIFLGQTEAPLLIRPYLKTMTRSEIMTMMTSGMATVAGGVLAAFVGMGISAGHLMAASLMSAPAAVLISKLMYPETEVSVTKGTVRVHFESPAVNVFDAACQGARDGMSLAMSVGAMLIAFIALIALVNFLIMTITGAFGYEVNFEQILGVVFYPFALLMGIPLGEASTVGSLLGQKVVINEFVAYIELAKLIKEGAISERSAAITTYALCGFANFSSIAIQIGGIGNLEPSRATDFARLAFRSMIGGVLAGFMTAGVASLLI